MVKNLPVNAGDTEDAGSIPGSGSEGMTTHSSVLVWRTPRTEASGGLQARVLQRVGHN